MTEIEQASVTMKGCSPERAERISRLIFCHLEEMLGPGCFRAGAPRALPHLRVPSLEVDWTLADDAIARDGATWIYRWLRSAE
jgi:hypothetical protein